MKKTTKEYEESIDPLYQANMDRFKSQFDGNLTHMDSENDLTQMSNQKFLNLRNQLGERNSIVVANK